MSYAHIGHLYKDQRILWFKECWAMEKVHGTSAHIRWDGEKMHLFSGGAAAESFAKCFDREELPKKLAEVFGTTPATIYGEAYGGKEQGMRDTYGSTLMFIAFDVQIKDYWLEVPQAVEMVEKVGLEFVPYWRVPATVESLDAYRDRPSEVAERRGCAGNTDKYGFCPPIQEGIVCRPIHRVYGDHMERICCKHKRHEFKERGNVPEVTDPEKLAVLEEAQAISEEWVTPMRLQHILDKLGNTREIKDIPKIIAAMQEDVLREAKGEIVEGKTTLKAIGTKAVSLFKDLLQEELRNSPDAK